jgi:hypothetical protein
MATNRTQLGILKRLLSQTDLIISSAKFPESARCQELLKSALALTDDLLTMDKLPAARILGSKGGAVTAKRGSDYFRQLAAKRRSHGGGRPRKETE